MSETIGIMADEFKMGYPLTYDEIYRRGRADAIDEIKFIWDRRVKDLINWCKDKRLMGLQQADSIFDEIAEQLKEQKE